MTASHPFAFMTVPVMAEAVGVYHTNPEIYYIPKQKALGKFNKEHGDFIYMIEERPQDDWLGTEFLGHPIMISQVPESFTVTLSVMKNIKLMKNNILNHVCLIF